MFRAAGGDGGGNGGGDCEIGVDAGEAGALVSGGETGDGFRGVAHGEDDVRAVGCGSEGGGRADGAGGAENDYFW